MNNKYLGSCPGCILSVWLLTASSIMQLQGVSPTSKWYPGVLFQEQKLANHLVQRKPKSCFIRNEYLLVIVVMVAYPMCVQCKHIEIAVHMFLGIQE
jgi:predicted ABC-type exoprotein transport system permease subunit